MDIAAMQTLGQFNAFTKNFYTGGKNQSELYAYKQEMGFKSDGWVTFLQAKQMGLKIKKGAKSIMVFKGYGEFEEKGKDGKITIVSRPIGCARVFNLDQTEKESEK